MTRSLLTLAAVVLVTAPLRAGLYFPGEPPELIFEDDQVKPLPWNAFQVMLETVRGTPNPGTEAHQKAKKVVDDLTAKGLGRLSVEELVRLSSYQARLKKDQEALGVLKTAQQREPRNFYVQANMAMVHQLQGSADALIQQSGVVRARPAELTGRTPGQAAWYLRVERFLFDLQKLRRQEERQAGGRVTARRWDDLFHVEFTNEAGEYAPGTIAAAQKAKLPADAVAVVQQLLLWLPDDARLYWLLAELYAATGNLEAAGTIFDDCRSKRAFAPDLLVEHRRVVKDELARRVPPPPAPVKTWRDSTEALWAAGAAAGVLLAVLVFWQVREIRRRLRGGRPVQR